MRTCPASKVASVATRARGLRWYIKASEHASMHGLPGMYALDAQGGQSECENVVTAWRSSARNSYAIFRVQVKFWDPGLSNILALHVDAQKARSWGIPRFPRLGCTKWI